VTDLDDLTRLSADASGGGSEGDADDASVGAESSPGRGRTKRVLIVALVLLLVPIAAIAGYGVYLGHLVSSNVQTENLLPALTPDQLAGKPGEPVPTGPGADPGHRQGPELPVHRLRRRPRPRSAAARTSSSWPTSPRTGTTSR
jgi:hypothetical protein